MCGITGIYAPQGGVPDPAVIERMSTALQHRGPDASGVYRDGPIHLGHRRLSVIDLEGSSQPMANADGSVVIVFNGEIYNFRELRATLTQGGREFRTRGDTEVILAAYEIWGADLVHHLRGMFAFAIWDSRRQRLLIARDHMGVKPLYYFRQGGGVVFASELKALEQHPGAAGEIDVDAIGLYLECQYIPGPRSVYRDIRKLPPAHLLLVEDGRCEERRYWAPSYATKQRLTEREAVDALEEVLARAVESMLVADVPLGIFVSGGVDSSLMAALARRARPEIDTFNLGFGDAAVSEHREARRVADHIGSRHHVLHVGPDDVLGELDRFCATYDEPFGDQAALSTLLLSRLTRQHVTVALSGEGADEVFGGYRSYRHRLKDNAIARWLDWPGSPMRLVAPLLPYRWRRSGTMRAIRYPLEERYQSMPRIFEEEAHPGLLTPAFLDQRSCVLRQLVAEHYRACDAADFLERMLHIDSKLWLPEDLLAKVDRATMAYSLEARVPYLDHRVVEFAATLPARLKVTRSQTKRVLKKLAERYLPHDIIYRRKHGFMMPLDRWLKQDLRVQIDDALGEGGLARRGIVRPQAISRLITEHRRGRRGHASGLWVLFALELWFRRHRPDFRVV